MNLIIGGAYQGKLNYVKTKYQVTECDFFFCSVEPTLAFDKKVISGLHIFVLSAIQHNIDPVDYIEKNLHELMDKIIITDDISCGIVPMDFTHRQWREQTGKIVQKLAAHSETVIRIFCGLEEMLKN